MPTSYEKQCSSLPSLRLTNREWCCCYSGISRMTSLNKPMVDVLLGFVGIQISAGYYLILHAKWSSENTQTWWILENVIKLYDKRACSSKNQIKNPNIFAVLFFKSIQGGSKQTELILKMDFDHLISSIQLFVLHFP